MKLLLAFYLLTSNGVVSLFHSSASISPAEDITPLFSSMRIMYATHSLAGLWEDVNGFVRSDGTGTWWVGHNRRELEPIDDILTTNLSFSLWYPSLHVESANSEEGEWISLQLLNVVRGVVCDDPGFELVSGEQRVLCNDDALDLSFDDFIESNRTSSVASLSDATLAGDNITKISFRKIVVREVNEEKGLEWLEWEVACHIEALGEVYWQENSNTINSTWLNSKLQQDLQKILDNSIQDGSATARFHDLVDLSLPLMSVVGTEIDTFQGAHLRLQDLHDYTNMARILRYLGISLLIFSTTAVLLLTRLSRARRRRKELDVGRQSHFFQHAAGANIEEPADMEVPNVGQYFESQGTEVVFLESEEATNHMLSLGRQHVLKVRP